MENDKEWISDVANAICLWLDENEQKQSLSTSDYIEKILKDPEQKKMIVLDIFGKTEVIEKFLNCIYDKNIKRINIKDGELTNGIVWNILESFIKAISVNKHSGKKLADLLDDYFTKAGKDKNPDINAIYGIVNNGRFFRNKVHPPEGKESTLERDVLVEVWNYQLLSIFLLTATERITPKKPDSPNNTSYDGLKMWFNEHKNLCANINASFSESYLTDTEQIATKVKAIVSSDKALGNTWKKLLKLIGDKGNVCETSNIELEFDFPTFLEAFIHSANCYLYSDTSKSIDSPSWDKDIEMFQKLSQHIKHYDQQVFDDIIRDHQKVQTIGKNDRLSSDDALLIDNYFFKAICLIGAIIIAVKMCTTGVVYYANNNISVKPFPKAKILINVTKLKPHYWWINYDKTRSMISSGSVGDYTTEKKINIKKGKWAIVLFDFPPKQEGSIRKIIYDINFPGLEDLNAYYEEKGINSEQDKKEENKTERPQIREEERETSKDAVPTPVIVRMGKNTLSISDVVDSMIYYTLDESIPTRNSNHYIEEIIPKHNCKVKAIAIAEGKKDSEVAEYNVDWFKVEGVEFKKKNGKLYMMSATEHADIYYTLDGTVPSSKTQRYIFPISVKQGTQVKAIATKKNFSNSQVTTYTVPPSNSPMEAIRDLLGRYWLGLVGIAVLALVIASVVYIGRSLDFPTRKAEPREQAISMPEELFPILDGKAWQVKEMEGTKIPDAQGSAKIVSINDEGTDCKMVITTNLRSQYREINFQYNRLTGSLYSPELGEGKVEKLTGFVTLKISFKGWIIEK